MRIKIIIQGLLILLPLISVGDLYSQESSYFGRFEVDFARGCEPLTVIVTETDTFPEDKQRQYDFGNGELVYFEPSEMITFTYDSAGKYKIIQVIQLDIPGIPKTDTLDIEVKEPLKPEFTVLACENNKATITIEPDQYEQYRIFFTDSDSITINKGDPIPGYSYTPGSHNISVKGLFIGGKDNCGTANESFQTISSLKAATLNSVYLTNKNQVNGSIDLMFTLSPNVIYQLDMASNIPAGFETIDLLQYPDQTYQLRNLNTLDNISIFRISAFDACQDKHLYSDTLSMVSLNAVALNSRNSLSWNLFPLKFYSYRVIRNDQVLFTYDEENARDYIDDDVKCGEDYCYSIEFRNQNGAISYSDTVCVTAYSTYFPPAIRNTSVSVEEDGVSLSWDPPQVINTIESYFIQRQVDDEIYATIDTTHTTVYFDQTDNAEEAPVCYRINYIDECENRSNIGGLACSIYLENPQEDSFIWSAYTGWYEGISNYYLEVLNEEGELLRQLDAGGNTTLNDPAYYKGQVEVYRVVGVPKDSSQDSVYSNTYLKILDGRLIIPSAFSPNGDGLNDLFFSKGTDMKEFRLRIYTRYGVLVFESENQDEGWDGTYNGEELPFGSYIFEVQATDYFDKFYSQTGTVVLIK